MVGSSFIFIAFGVFLVVFVLLGVFLVRAGVKGAAAQREVLESASAEELEAFRAVHKERSSNAVLKIGAPIFTLVGGVILAVGISAMQRASESESWPMVKGEVIRTDIVRERARNGGGSTYQAKVEYQYAIEGVTHYGSRVSFAGNVNTSNRGAAMKITDQYRKGTEVAVYYDPADPEESVLEPGLSAMIFLMPAIGGVFLVIGLGLLFALLVGKRKDQELEPFE